MSVSRPGGKKGDEEEDWRGTEETAATTWVCDRSPSAAKVLEVGLWVLGGRARKDEGEEFSRLVISGGESISIGM